MADDIRWVQRLDSFSSALSSLRSAVGISNQRALSELETQGLIQAFEFTHELSWKLLKDFLEDRGASGIYGSRDAVREAFNRGLIGDGEVWMRMIVSRNRSSHTYKRSTAEEIALLVRTQYFSEFEALEKTMTSLKEKGEA
jgi:nucleotidyltransferase substrate binding protein, HI0074 family